MALNVLTEAQNQYESLTDRLNKLDQYISGTDKINPQDFAKAFEGRPAGVNPMEWIAPNIKTSEALGTTRGQLSQERSSALDRLIKLQPETQTPDTISAKDRLSLEIQAADKGLEIFKTPEGTLSVRKRGQQVDGTVKVPDIKEQIKGLPTVGERNSAVAVKDILDVLNSAIKKSQGVETGPISAAKAKASQVIPGMTPNKTAQLGKDLAEILRTIRKESTGVAFSPQEIKDLEKEIPTILQQEGNVADSLTRLKGRMLQKLSNLGVDVSSEMGAGEEINQDPLNLGI
jgi:hypothetical protein